MNNNVTKKIALKEIIIVEGRDDVTAVKRVISSEVIPLHGFTGMTKAKIDFLIQLSKTNDLILLTDPDFVGKKLREVISKRIPTIKHAYISRVEGTKDHKDGTKNIGIENASNESILNALSNTINSQTYSKDNNYIFTIQDLIDNGLSVGTNACNCSNIAKPPQSISAQKRMSAVSGNAATNCEINRLLPGLKKPP